MGAFDRWVLMVFDNDGLLTRAGVAASVSCCPSHDIRPERKCQWTIVAGVTPSNDRPLALPLGTNVVTWTATDASGNTRTCQQTVIVEDHENPTVKCPHDVSVPAASSAGSHVTYSAPIASDNCSIATVSSVPASGSVFPIGETTVSNTVTDANGNTSTCTFTVYVRVKGSQVFSFAPATNFGISGGDFALVADLNTDGKPDVVTCGSGDFTILLGDGNAGFVTNQSFGGNYILTSVAASDLNHDGCLDLAVLDSSLAELHTYMATNCWYASRTTLSVPPWTLSVTSADFNEDGHPDYAIVSRPGETMSILLGDGTGGLLAAPVSIPISGEPYFVEAADLDNDGHTDLAIVCRTGKRVVFLYGYGD